MKQQSELWPVETLFLSIAVSSLNTISFVLFLNSVSWTLLQGPLVFFFFLPYLLLQTKQKTLVSSWCLEWDSWHTEETRPELVSREIPRMSSTSVAPQQVPWVRQGCPHSFEAIANAPWLWIPTLVWWAAFPGWWPPRPAVFFTGLLPFRSEWALFWSAQG